MERHEVINYLSRGRFKTYLEIGVDYGQTFNKVEITKKIGVDPLFKVPIESLHGACYQLTSDTYFGVYENKFDCIFIDGLHTYEQSKRDFLNAMEHLNEGGIVILDDCTPPDELAAIPDVNECLMRRKEAGQENNMTWTGDVYKTVFWINDFTDYCYALVKELPSVLVVWKDKRRNLNKFFANEEEIANCDYKNYLTKNIGKASKINIRIAIGAYGNKLKDIRKLICKAKYLLGF